MTKPYPTRVALTGRILVGFIFVLSGLAKLASTQVVTAGHIVSDGFPLDTVPALVLGTLEIIGGAALGLGYKARGVAFALAAFVLVTSFLFHRFWAIPPEMQFAQQLLFIKNLAVIGGLLFIAGTATAADVEESRLRSVR